MINIRYMAAIVLSALMVSGVSAADRTLFPIFDSEYQQAEISFDGTNHHNTKVSHINLKSEVTVVAWVKTSSTQQSMAVLASDDDGVKGRIQLFMNQGNSQELRFYIKNDGDVLADVYGYPATSNVNMLDGLWHNIAVTVNLDDPSLSMVYVDGQPISTVNVNGTGGNLDKLATTLYVGANHRVVPSQSTGELVTNHFIGEIKKVRLYRKILTTEEVNNLFNEMR